MLASPAHLYMPHLFTHCLPTIICVMLMSIAFFFYLYTATCLMYFLYFTIMFSFTHCSKYKYLFLKRCRKSNNVWLHALMQSDCLYSSLFFEHYNRILLCEWVIELLQCPFDRWRVKPQCFRVSSHNDYNVDILQTIFLIKWSHQNWKKCLTTIIYFDFDTFRIVFKRIELEIDHCILVWQTRWIKNYIFLCEKMPSKWLFIPDIVLHLLDQLVFAFAWQMSVLVSVFHQVETQYFDQAQRSKYLLWSRLESNWTHLLWSLVIIKQNMFENIPWKFAWNHFICEDLAYHTLAERRESAAQLQPRYYGWLNVYPQCGVINSDVRVYT